MKLTHLFYVILVLGIGACAGTPEEVSDPNATVVSGKLTNGNGAQIFLEDISGQAPKAIDTAIIAEDGTFMLSTMLDAPSFYRISFSNTNFAVFILQRGEKVKVTGDALNLGKTYSVEGSKETNRLMAFNELRAPLDSIGQVIQMAQQQQDAGSYYAAVQAQQALVPTMRGKMETFINEDPGSIASFAAVKNLSIDDDFELYEKVANAMGERYPDFDYTKMIQQEVASNSKLRVGNDAPDINLQTPGGEYVSLSSLRGKVVMIDFWASWCKPCRAENPNVVKLYDRYHDQGFEILGVSLDRSKDQWVKAIDDDGLEWLHISDLGFWNSSVVPVYNVKSIPKTYLIDKEGKILAKNLRGPALESKLAEIFGA